MIEFPESANVDLKLKEFIWKLKRYNPDKRPKSVDLIELVDELESLVGC
jgi:hypothetical protein